MFGGNDINFLAGIQVGLILTPPITSVVTDTFGWETCFYMVGTMTCIWFAFWAYFVYNSPEEHPRISKVSELNDICWASLK